MNKDERRGYVRGFPQAAKLALIHAKDMEKLSKLNKKLDGNAFEAYCIYNDISYILGKEERKLNAV
jgi:hypothetical protein